MLPRMLHRIANKSTFTSRVASMPVRRPITSRGTGFVLQPGTHARSLPKQVSMRGSWKHVTFRASELWASRSFAQQYPVCVAHVSTSDEDLPEAGTPEAPPQVPDGTGTLPGSGDPAVETLPNASDDAESPSMLGPAYLQLWKMFEEALVKNGADLTADETIDDKGALKRACIKVSRDRPEAIYSLNSIDISAFTAQCLIENRAGGESPLTDRKCFNALQRLEASFVKESHLEVSRGGPAEFTDLIRVLFSLYFFIQGNFGPLSQDMMASSVVLLEDVTNVLTADPTPEAVAMAAEADVKRAMLAEEMVAARSERETERRQRFESRGQRFDSGRRFDSAGAGPRSGAREQRPGDWVCSDCGFMNFASRTDCRRCSKPLSSSDEVKISDFQPAMSPRNGSGFREGTSNAPDMRPGDWVCPTCSFHNFASRVSCKRCQTPREDGIDAFDQAPNFGDQRRSQFGSGAPRIVRDNRSGGFQRSGAEQNLRPGDWICPDCGINNFASRRECFRCNLPKPPGSEVQSPGGGRRFDGGGRPPSRGFSGPPSQAENVPPPTNLDW